jgi:hypothetical protein
MANAAALTQVMVRFDRMKTSTWTSGLVCAKPTSTAAEGNVQVTFPAGFTLGVAANFTTSTATTTGWPAGAQQWLSIQAQATSVAGQVVTWTSGDLTAGTLYCFNWTNTTTAVQTASSASSTLTGTVATLTAASVPIDSSTYTANTIADDQILVNATVPQAFSFVLGSNTDTLSLASGSVVTSSPAINVTINTNSKNGWQVWAKDLNAGLNSASASYNIASTAPGTNRTLVAGTQDYNTGVTYSQTGGTGTQTVDPAYVGGSLGKGGGLDTSLRSLIASTGTTNAGVVALKNSAAITATTPAATDYTDTITVVGAGLF